MQVKIDFNSLDNIGHGVSSSNALPRKFSCSQTEVSECSCKSNVFDHIQLI